MAANPDLTQSHSNVHKVVLLGDSGVGKTSIFYRINDGFFRDTGSSTTQIAQFEKSYRTPDGEVLVRKYIYIFVCLFVL